MSRRSLASLIAVAAAGLLVTVAGAQTVKPAGKAWVAPRLPWGDPDIAGIFTTDDDDNRRSPRQARRKVADQAGDRRAIID